MPATLITPTAMPSADELMAAYGTLVNLWNTLFALREQGLEDPDAALAETECAVLSAAQAIVHRHYLVARYPEQHLGHYRVKA